MNLLTYGRDKPIREVVAACTGKALREAVGKERRFVIDGVVRCVLYGSYNHFVGRIKPPYLSIFIYKLYELVPCHMNNQRRGYILLLPRGTCELLSTQAP